MSIYIDATHHLCHMDGSAFLSWIFLTTRAGVRLEFVRWDASRKFALPGQPKRENELVALLREISPPGREIWCILGVEEKPDPNALKRLADWAAELAQEVNPTGDPAGALVGSILLNLTGSQRAGYGRWDLTPGRRGVHLGTLILDIANENAMDTLARVDAGAVGTTVLPLVPLMGTPGGTIPSPKGEGRRPV